MNGYQQKVLYKALSAIELIVIYIADQREIPTKAARDAEFEENKHPRKKDGKFAPKGQEESYRRQANTAVKPGTKISEKPTEKEIRNIASKFEDQYNIVGVRTQEHPFKLGPIKHSSKVWENGNETKKTLPGISVTDIDSNAVNMHTPNYKRSYYSGGYTAIIAGNHYEPGEDQGEKIVADPVVVALVPHHVQGNKFEQINTENPSVKKTSEKPYPTKKVNRFYEDFVTEMNKKYGNNMWFKMTGPEIDKAEYLESHPNE